MVYTKHFVVHATWKLNQLKDYIEAAHKVNSQTDGHSHFDNIFDYVVNEDKTISKKLVSGHGLIDLDDMAEEFIQTHMYAKNETGNAKIIFKSNEVLAHHLIQSFSPEDELSPEEVHEIGRKTVLELTGGHHEFVIATHLDKGHLHNHIVFNSVSTADNKKFRWQKNTKKVLEKISDRHADYAGAKIIEQQRIKNGKTYFNDNFKSYSEYHAYTQEKSFKKEIKQRLDFLLENSLDMDDLLLKSKVLNLEIDFSGKYAKYRLLDEAQVRPTRSRSLSRAKKDDGKYDFMKIKERIFDNEVVISPEEIKEAYDELKGNQENDFELNFEILENQVDKVTSHGLYVNVNYGLNNSGLIFIPNKFIEKNELGNFDIYIKENEFFYFMNQEDSRQNRYLKGETLAQQMAIKNGTVPIRKPKEIRELSELIEALNFLAVNDVTNGVQFENLSGKLDEKFSKVEANMKVIEEKISKLKGIAKLIHATQSEDIISQKKAEVELEKLSINPGEVKTLHVEIESLEVEKAMILTELDEIKRDFEFYQRIEKTVTKDKINSTDNEKGERRKG